MNNGFGSETYKRDTISTSSGNLIITFVGHGTLMFNFNNEVIHIDPVSQEADYASMPKADIILVTHEHGDHFDIDAIKKITSSNTKLIFTQKCADNAKSLSNYTVMKNGDKIIVKNINIEAVPAYNIVNKRPDGSPFHPKGAGNGYILTFGDKRVYIAGDTENTPEMKSLKNIDIAFLPMNLPYTMTPAMVADAAKAFKPKILYPYHYGNTNTNELVNLLKNNPEIEVRIRDMK